MEEIKSFKSIITFTFSDNSEIGKAFVNLLKEKYNADPQDQSTYGIPENNLSVDEVNMLCIEALNGNTNNYNLYDEVRLFKPIGNNRLVMYKINPYDVQCSSDENSHNRDIRQMKYNYSQKQ